MAITSGVEDKAYGMFETIASSHCPVSECWDSLPENNIFELHRGGKKCFDLLNQGILHISEIPPEVKLTAVQRIQQACEISGNHHLDETAIRDFVGSL